MRMRTWTSGLVVAILAAGLAAPRAGAAKDIVETAVGAGSFKTLAAALQAGGLVEALQGKGPFTVFAPTDEAFAKLPAGTVESLLKPENKDRLVAILTYHVVPGAVKAADVVKLNAADTLNGQRVAIAVQKGSVSVDEAKVVKTDIECDNGVIHVIDSVILPSEADIPTTAVEAGKFETLVAALKAANLVETLAGKGPFTVFAPTDEAFAKLPAGTVDSLLKEENRDQLTAILTYHVVPGRVYSDAALGAGEAKTLQGGKVKITANQQGAMVNEAKLLATDIDASNGVIHVIDAVLLPPAEDAAAVTPRQRMKEAVAEGSRQYNQGHASACAQTYTHAMQEILGQENHGLNAHAVKAMTSALHRAQHTHCADSKAWILRRGMEAAYRSMSEDLADTPTAG